MQGGWLQLGLVTLLHCSLEHYALSRGRGRGRGVRGREDGGGRREEERREEGEEEGEGDEEV